MFFGSTMCTLKGIRWRIVRNKRFSHNETGLSIELSLKKYSQQVHVPVTYRSKICQVNVQVSFLLPEFASISLRSCRGKRWRIFMTFAFPFGSDTTIILPFLPAMIMGNVRTTTWCWHTPFGRRILWGPYLSWSWLNTRKWTHLASKKKWLLSADKTFLGSYITGSPV